MAKMRVVRTGKQRLNRRIERSAKKLYRIIMRARAKMTPQERARADRNTDELFAEMDRQKKHPKSRKLRG